MSGNTAGSSNGILPEIVKVCFDELLVYLLDLFVKMGEFHRIGEMPYCFLLPKKGYLSV